MKIQLSDHFNYKKLLRFTLPSIVMMIFTSIYGVVDGFFISNFAGKTEFAAVNFIMPVIMIVGGLGFMIGTGGSAIVARTLGEGRREKANEYFSMMIYVTVVLGLVVAVLGEILLRPVTYALGAEGDMAEYCILYGRISFLSIMQFMLQNVFQSFFVTAQKPQLGLAVIIAAGVTNMVLDYLFVGVFQWSVAGAAAATAISETIGAAIPLTYFAFKNSSLLRLTKCRIQGKILLKACTNGSSELMTNISTSLVNMLYNLQLMRIAGEKRRSGLWCHHVCKLYFYRRIYRLFHRQRADCRISLRRGTSRRTEESATAQPAYRGTFRDFHADTGGDLRRTSDAVFRGI